MQSARESGRVVRLGTSGTHLVRRRHATLCCRVQVCAPSQLLASPEKGARRRTGTDSDRRDPAGEPGPFSVISR